MTEKPKRRKKIKLHPLVKELYRLEKKAMREKYFFALAPICEARDKIEYRLATIKDGKGKGWT